jgi:hypothetical protein
LIEGIRSFAPLPLRDRPNATLRAVGVKDSGVRECGNPKNDAIRYGSLVS